MAVWSDLEGELVYTIFEKLAEEDCRDVLRSAGVCVSWRSIYQNHFKPIIPPLVFLSNAGMHFGNHLPPHRAVKESCLLFNPVSNKRYEIKSLSEELREGWFYIASSSSSFGWLITIGFDKPHQVSLLNLNTRVRISLPPVDENLNVLVVPSRFIISNPPDVIVIAVHYSGCFISYAKPGDKSWRGNPFPSRVSNTIFYKGEFYAVDYSANIFRITLDEEEIKFCSLDTSIKKTEFQKCYLIELNGDLLLVSETEIEPNDAMVIEFYDDEADLQQQVVVYYHKVEVAADTQTEIFVLHVSCV